MRAEELTVVQDLSGPAGLVTWWRLSGTIDLSRLVAVWALESLPDAELPSKPTWPTALRRALAAEYEQPHTLVRTLPAGGYAIVDELFEDADERKAPKLQTRFRAWLDKEQNLVVRPPLTDAGIGNLRNQMNAKRNLLDATDVSTWLVQRAALVKAVKLRDTGGIYFVPETHAADWRSFAKVLHEISDSRIFMLPAVKSTEAVEAVIDALRKEAQQASDVLAHELEHGDLGGRALKSRSRLCDDMAAKLRAYEQLLDVKLDALKLSFEELDGRVAAAILAQESAAEVK